MPLAYPIAGEDASWVQFVNAWVKLKRADGTVARLYEQWILGKAASRPRLRWSVIRDVLHWVN